MTRTQTQQTLRRLPVKWALALLAIIVVYAIAQPALNSRLGLNLPSLAALMGEPEPKQTEPKKSGRTWLVPEEPGQKTKAKSSKAKSSNETKEETAARLSEEADGAAEATLTSVQEKASTTEQRKSNGYKGDSQIAKTGTKPTDSEQTKTQSEVKAAPEKSKASAPNSTLLYGILKDTGRERYLSVEGLQYNPGSEEGHRLKHLERHLKDIPNRPGKHGVFNGEMKDALKWIDDAYARGKRGATGVRKSEEENRTIYEVPFSQPIGYIGGRDGKRVGNPPAKRLRLVVEGSKFITAFPF